MTWKVGSKGEVFLFSGGLDSLGSRDNTEARRQGVRPSPEALRNMNSTRLLALVLRTLPLPGRLLMVIDDSPTKRYGPKVEGADIHRNPTPGPADQMYLTTEKVPGTK